MINIGIVGLGLIGASMAKSAHKNSPDVKILGYDIDTSIKDYALLSGIIDEELCEDNLSTCDAVFICLYPGAVVDYVSKNASLFKKDSVIIDCAGVKCSVCAPCYEIAKEHGFHFVGGHPMAGAQYSGIKYSKDTLFHNACFVLVPEKGENIEVTAKAREFVLTVGFKRISVMTPQRHDELIAFTSQLAHVVSNAYVKSPCAMDHKGISAGSFRDLTRVAYLNENMWTELFMANRENLLCELNNLISNLQGYADALESGDSDKLRSLLKEGKLIKEGIE